MATASRTFRSDSSALWRILSLAVFLFLTSAVAALGSIATRSGQDYQDSLSDPAISPPDWAFGAVWTPLYVFIAVAGWLIYRSHAPGRPLALAAWAVQLALNLAWTYIFFTFERPGIALVEIVLLLAAILVTIGLSWRVSRAAALFMVPYAAWVMFATALNFEYWRLN